MKKVIMISVLCVVLALAGGGFLLYRVIDSGFFTGASAKRSELIGTWSGPRGGTGNTGPKIRALIDDLYVMGKEAKDGIYIQTSEDSPNRFVFKKSP
ncbi:hypothetical protein RM550_36610 [Streptomyces sp. DSM 41527]|uniref:Uncharacterized protein n=1 Tax=Streptomyces mooreae TaxID=3075523 RepID=A0ABU2TJQ2_9ACTN|nr:hypothetical protein [Streptomyces sp. DSM 41527]MDT0461165.1 hypothetical protein [Streptomyces sp. DSM 41527]